MKFGVLYKLYAIPSMGNERLLVSYIADYIEHVKFSIISSWHYNISFRIGDFNSMAIRSYIHEAILYETK
jgi:hypothetical protein